MKKVVKSSKKGFTLVELIVVLVILAVLAAMLVPALVGYIDKAKAEKDYQMAATVLTAAQAAATYQYSINGTKTITWTTSAGNGVQVKDLVGDASGKVSTCSFTANDDYVITGGSVTIDGHTYTWQPDATGDTPMWSVS